MTIAKLYALFQKSTGVFTDTRHPIHNGIFFGLRGPNFNGNVYARKALASGAIAAVVDDHQIAEENPKCILVENSLKSLQELAQYHRRRLNTTIIGLTGSNGKTTTKELIHAVLSQKYTTQATAGNLNNHIGVPLTLLKISQACEIAVVEMGANHQGEIKELARISEPDIGYITNFGYAHIEGFGSLEGVVKGKSELYDNLKQRNKKIVIHGDDPKQLALMEDYPFVSFGTAPSNTTIVTYHTAPQQPVAVSANGHQYTSNLHGNYNAANIGVAIAFGQLFNLEPEQIAAGIASYIPNNQRSEWKSVKGNRVFLDAYNANPSSMKEALQSFAAHHPGSIVVLGDMYELGEISQASHQEIAALAVDKGFKKIVLVGKLFEGIALNHTTILYAKDAMAVKDLWRKEQWKDEVILIKGSRGMALENIISDEN
ncbi:MAG: UDP-N-acetylmuramoyl-tripeptide--D-alanyl-D-alanine ligase [Flavobacteriaceae bacterium]